MSDADIKVPKGTRDLTGEEVAAFQRVEGIARRVFGSYLFTEVRTPIFEQVELFSRSLGATSDVVEKEMFTFSDRGERTYALRPEGTAGVVRYFIENKLSVKAGVHRLFYVGPMFRGERPQAGRYRQFWQIGSEHFGQTDASADADTVLIVASILREAGIDNFSVHVNSLGCKTCRPSYRDALKTYLQSRAADLTEETRRRMETNPLRALDSKVDGPKLSDAPVMKSYLCADCKAHYEEFLALAKPALGPALEENLRLVRGLDYYTRTVFEFVSPDLGAQSALAAGGRYDDLVEMLGGPATPGVGFALGLDRVVSVAMKRAGLKAGAGAPVIFVMPLMESAAAAAFSVARELRSAGFSVPPIQPRKKMKNQLSSAVDSGAKWAILIGEDELKAEQVTLKDLATREQSSLPARAIAGHLRSVLAKTA